MQFFIKFLVIRGLKNKRAIKTIKKTANSCLNVSVSGFEGSFCVINIFGILVFLSKLCADDRNFASSICDDIFPILYFFVNYIYFAEVFFFLFWIIFNHFFFLLHKIKKRMKINFFFPNISFPCTEHSFVKCSDKKYDN